MALCDTCFHRWIVTHNNIYQLGVLITIVHIQCSSCSERALQILDYQIAYVVIMVEKTLMCGST